MSPFKRGNDFDEDEAAALRTAILATLAAAPERYEQVVSCRS